MKSKRPSVQNRSAFYDSVHSIVPTATKKQVAWIYACRSVASVKHKLAFWYSSVVNVPRYFVSFEGSIPHVRTSEEQPVLPVCCSNPKPATSGFINLRPEAHLQRRELAAVAAIVGLAVFDLVWPYSVLTSASQAGLYVRRVLTLSTTKLRFVFTVWLHFKNFRACCAFNFDEVLHALNCTKEISLAAIA